MICHYWLFNHEFKYQDSVCNDCHDLLIKWVNISNITIMTFKGFNYRCIIHDISKPDAINLLKKFEINDLGLM